MNLNTYREEWAVYPEIPQYMVSDLGKVRNRNTGKRIRQHVSDRGYAKVNLNGKTRRVHRMVLMAFEPTEDVEQLTVNHKDFNKLNNALDNLEWMSIEDNQKHYQDSAKRVLVFDDSTGEVIDEMRTKEEAAAKYGVSKSAVIELCKLYSEGVYAQENGFGFCNAKDFGIL